MALFFPSGVDTVDIVANNAHLHWLQALLPVITHLAALPALLYAWRIRAYGPFGGVSISLVHSALYHTCLSWATACLGVPVHILRMGDYIWSPYVMAVGMEFVLRLYVYPWVSLISLTYLFVILFSTLVNPFSIQTQLLIVVISALLLFLKASYLDIDSALVRTGANGQRDLRIDRTQRFHVPSLLTGAICMAVALVGFFFEAPTMYWLMHSVLWHVPIYLSLYFIMLGTTRDVAGWYDVFGFLCGGFSRHDADDVRNSASRVLPDAAPDAQVVFYSTPLFGAKK